MWRGRTPASACENGESADKQRERQPNGIQRKREKSEHGANLARIGAGLGAIDHLETQPRSALSSPQRLVEQKRCFSIPIGTGPIAAGELSRRFVRCFASPRRAGEVVDSSIRARLFAVRGPFEHSRKET